MMASPWTQVAGASLSALGPYRLKVRRTTSNDVGRRWHWLIIDTSGGGSYISDGVASTKDTAIQAAIERAGELLPADIHPDSMRDLRALVRLHGSARIERAVKQIERELVAEYDRESAAAAEKGN